MSASPDAVTADPHWLCIGYQRERGELHFAFAEDARLDAAAFLDEPWIDFGSRRAFALDEVAAALPAADSRAPPRLVLHTSFCCSTLMARCLEMPGRVRALRELTAFNGLARTRLRLGPDAREWPRLVDCIAWLSSRAFDAGGVTVNKPSNVMLGAAPELLSAHPESRAIAMYSELPDYLVSCAKKGRGTHARLLAMHDATDPVADFATRFGLVPATLGPLELGALVWTLHMHLLRAIGAVTVLDARRFLDAPFAAVRAAQARLGIVVGADATHARVDRELRRHAKQSDAAYDPQQRARDARLVREHFRAPLDAALAWAERRFGAWQEWLPKQPALSIDGAVETG